MSRWCSRHSRTAINTPKNMKDGRFCSRWLGLPITRTDPVILQAVIQTSHICHKTARSVQNGKLLLDHVAHSPIAFMNHQWTINLHDGYPPLNVLLTEEYIPPSLPTLCNLKSTMFHFGVDLLYSFTRPQHDLPSLASAEGEMASSFSWTSFFKSPTSSTLCFGEPTLAKLNQVKLLHETEFCITKFYFVWTI